MTATYILTRRFADDTNNEEKNAEHDSENRHCEGQDPGLIEQLPDNATWDDVAYEIAVRRSIERGLEDLEAKRTYTTEALLESLGLSE